MLPKGYARVGLAAFELNYFHEVQQILDIFITAPENISHKEGMKKYLNIINKCKENYNNSNMYGNKNIKCYKVLINTMKKLSSFINSY